MSAAGLMTSAASSVPAKAGAIAPSHNSSTAHTARARMRLLRMFLPPGCVIEAGQASELFAVSPAWWILFGSR